MTTNKLRCLLSCEVMNQRWGVWLIRRWWKDHQCGGRDEQNSKKYRKIRKKKVAVCCWWWLHALTPVVNKLNKAISDRKSWKRRSKWLQFNSRPRVFRLKIECSFRFYVPIFHFLCMHIFFGEFSKAWNFLWIFLSRNHFIYWYLWELSDSSQSIRLLLFH